MKYLRFVILVLMLCLLLVSCKSDDEVVLEVTPEPPQIDEIPAELETYSFSPDDFPRLDGSPVTRPLAEAVTMIMLGQTRNDVTNLASFSRTTQAFRNLACGLSDLIITGEPDPLVFDEISRQDFRYDIAPIATDALVFIVSTSNPVENLTSQQVKDIYAGNITSWHDVGGDNIDILACQRNEEASSQVLLEKLVMDWNSLADPPMQNIFSSSFFNPDLSLSAIKGFDSNPGVIGFTMYYYAADMTMADGYKILSIDGVLPTAETISKGDYPFLSPYYAVVSKDLTEDDSSRILFNWLISDDGQDFIGSLGYVSIKNSPPLDDVSLVSPAQMRWTVATNDTYLEPDYTVHSYTRLYNSALPALEPYDGYGVLFPYSTAVTMNDGSIYPSRYGFVSANSAIIITDPVYDNIERARYTTNAGSITHTAPVYRIEIFKEDSEYGFSRILGVCANDGSWVTGITYTNAIFRESVIFLMYDDDDTFNIDVYDYYGNLLYNMLDLDWAYRISDETGSWQFVQSEGEGYGFILLDDDSYAMVDVTTGEITETEFAAVFTFSEGLVCVSPGDSGGLWGFADKNLETVIPPVYAGEAFFSGGRAIVQTPDGRQSVIDKQGETLYTADDGHILSSLPDNYGYRIISLSDAAYPRFLTRDFENIAYPDEITGFDPEAVVNYLKNGWISYISQDNVRLFHSEDSYSLPLSVSNIADIYDNILVFEQVDSQTGTPCTGVMTLSGDILLPASAGKSVRLYSQHDYIWLVENTEYAGSGLQGGGVNTYTSAQYTLYEIYGSNHGYAEPSAVTVMSGYGMLTFEDTLVLPLMYVHGTDFFRYMWSDMNVSIPSLAYTYD